MFFGLYSLLLSTFLHSIPDPLTQGRRRRCPSSSKTTLVKSMFRWMPASSPMTLRARPRWWRTVKPWTGTGRPPRTSQLQGEGDLYAFIFFFSRLLLFAASIDYCPSMRCHLCCECCCFYTFLLLLLLILLVLLLLFLNMLPLCLFSQASSVLVCCPSTDHDHEIFFPGDLGPALSGEYIDEALAAGDGGRREEPYYGDEDGNVMLESRQQSLPKGLIDVCIALLVWQRNFGAESVDTFQVWLLIMK